MSEKCPKKSEKLLKNVHKVSKERPKSVRQMSEECRKNVQKVSEKCPRGVKNVSEKCPTLFYEVHNHNWIILIINMYNFIKENKINAIEM